MLVRLGFLVAVAAFAVKRVRKPKPSRLEPKGNGEESAKPDWIDETQKEQDGDSSISQRKDHVEEEEEEEVKRISSVISPALPGNPVPPLIDDDDDDMLPEFENLLSGEIEFPLPSNKFDVKPTSQYDAEMANNAAELERLRTLVKELEEREVKLEGELLEYYGLKEQETDFTELQKQLKIKTVEVDKLNITINSLQAERKKLQEEIAAGAAAKKELEVARNKIKELQRQIQLDAKKTKGQLVLLKQQVTGLQVKEEELAKRDAEVEKKLRAVRELEVEVVELRRKNKELQHDKRALTVKLDAAEAKVTAIANMTEALLCFCGWRGPNSEVAVYRSIKLCRED